MVANLPLFPLSTVLMPGAPLPLHIFEPRYRQLTVDLVTGAVPGKRFGVIAVREGFDGDETAVLHGVGCTAELLDVDTEARPYLMAEVEYLPDLPQEPADDLADLAGAARAAHRRYCATAWKSGDWSEPDQDVGPAELPHLLAADCLLPMSDRQRLLEQTRQAIRLRMVRALMIREAGLLGTLHAVPAPLHTYTVDASPN